MRQHNELFPVVKDAISFENLQAQGEKVISDQSGNIWSDKDKHDPGITLLDSLSYGVSDLAYRHSLPLTDLLTIAGKDTLFPAEFGPQQTLTCGPITLDDYRRALLDLHGNDAFKISASDPRDFLFQDIQLICEPKSKRYKYYFNPETLEYTFTPPSGDKFKTLTLRGNYWLYWIPTRWAGKSANLPLVKRVMEDFLRENRNLGENVVQVTRVISAPIYPELVIELADDITDAAPVLASIYMLLEQWAMPMPARFTTEALQAKGLTNEEIFDGPWLRHGWIPQLPTSQNYHTGMVLKMNHLINQLLAVEGIKRVVSLTLPETEYLHQIKDDNWSWQLDVGYYPLLWGANPLEVITEKNNNYVKLFAKGGVRLQPDQKSVERLLSQESLINNAASTLPAGKVRDLKAYTPVSRRLPACYGLQNTLQKLKPEQRHLYQFLLPLEQMLADGCARLAFLPHLLAFRDRSENISDTLWPFKNTEDTIAQQIHQEYAGTLKAFQQQEISLFDDKNRPHHGNINRELDILDYLLGYFGTQRAKRPLTQDIHDFLQTQRGYLAQQPELGYQRDNIRIDRVSALQKRIAARIGLDGTIFKESVDLSKLPFYLIEHRQLLPNLPHLDFQHDQTPQSFVISDNIVKVKQAGIADKIVRGQLIDFIDIESKFTVRAQMIVAVEGNEFSLDTKNSIQLEKNLQLLQSASEKNNLRWRNSTAWLEDMTYRINYTDDQVIDDKTKQCRLQSNTKSPFPALIAPKNKITIIKQSSPLSSIAEFTDEPEFKLVATVTEIDRIEGILTIERDDNQLPFPTKEESNQYIWYISDENYISSDRFSFVVSVVLNRGLVEREDIDQYKLEEWIERETLAEFPAHISLITHWLASENFDDFAKTYQRWQNNGAQLGDESYTILEKLTLGHLPTGLTGISNMFIATEAQRLEVVGESGNEWNTQAIINNELFYVPSQNS
ncbi:hypothetical protein [Photorhabdus asymbiotica]|uniref:hypothetical protein n=1 Tax=Photorhabdus asymbiotica TaxID=291112 RepID=UPI003DA75E97